MRTQKRKKPNYYTPIQRWNVIKDLLVDIFHGICSWPRLVLEVALRRNLGQRYFSLSSSISILLFLSLAPYLGKINWALFFRKMGEVYLPPFDFWELVDENPAWYFFVLVFMGLSIYRRYEITRYSKLFDMERYSLSSGDIYGFFYRPWILKFSLKEGQLRIAKFHVKFLKRDVSIYVSIVRIVVSTRTVETLTEPLFCFVFGYFLREMYNEPAGYLVQTCSVLYSFSYFASYYKGDQFVMDKIDEMIINRDFEGSFVEDDESNTSGFRFVGRKPVDKDRRRRLLNTMNPDFEKDE